MFTICMLSYIYPFMGSSLDLSLSFTFKSCLGVLHYVHYMYVKLYLPIYGL